jgi:hypothetical protein
MRDTFFTEIAPFGKREYRQFLRRIAWQGRGRPGKATMKQRRNRRRHLWGMRPQIESQFYVDYSLMNNFFDQRPYTFYNPDLIKPEDLNRGVGQIVPLYNHPVAGCDLNIYYYTMPSNIETSRPRPFLTPVYFDGRSEPQTFEMSCGQDWGQKDGDSVVTFNTKEDGTIEVYKGSKKKELDNPAT